MKKKYLILCGIVSSMIAAGCQGRTEAAPDPGQEQKQISSTEEKEEEEQSAERDIFAMDTYMSVTAYGENAGEAVKQAEAEIRRLDALLSTGDPESEVARINTDGGGILSDDTAYLMERSLELYEDTGVFDVAVYPVMELWGFPTGNYQVPDEEELEKTRKLTEPENILYDPDTRNVRFGVDGMAIDFGGIAKGYTSSRITDIYRSCGVTSGMINLGGNVQVLGTKVDGSPWRVAIQSPDAESEYLGVLSVTDKAVITSGGYERYFEEDGVTYHHIIDPGTGRPADNGLTSVTIVSADGTLADGLSTSLFIMGEEDAVAYWKKHKEQFDTILLTEDGRILVTEGIADLFSSEHAVTVIQ